MPVKPAVITQPEGTGPDRFHLLQDFPALERRSEIHPSV